jgi:hypothetical protein
LQERQTAKTLFLTADGLPTALATTISTTVSTHSKPPITTDEPKPAAVGKAGRLMSKEEVEKVKEAIAKATSVEEIRKLERSLREGYLPERDTVGAWAARILIAQNVFSLYFPSWLSHASGESLELFTGKIGYRQLIDVYTKIANPKTVEAKSNYGD